MQGELRAAVEAIREEWTGELRNQVLPTARDALAEATEAWVARATALDDSYALSAWLARWPEGKGFILQRRPLLTLPGPNGSPIDVAVIEDAMRALAKLPKPPSEPVTVPLQVRGY